MAIDTSGFICIMIFLSSKNGSKSKHNEKNCSWNDQYLIFIYEVFNFVNYVCEQFRLVLNHLQVYQDYELLEFDWIYYFLIYDYSLLEDIDQQCQMSLTNNTTSNNKLNFGLIIVFKGIKNHFESQLKIQIKKISKIIELKKDRIFSFQSRSIFQFILIIILMETNIKEFTIESLPKRPQTSKAVDKFTKDQIVTNYYKLTQFKNHIIYQYDITFDPPLPQDSRGLFKGLVSSVQNELKNKLKFYIHRGKIIYAFAKLDGIQSFKCKYTHKTQDKSEEKVYDNLLSLVKTKDFELGALYGGSRESQKVLQVLNSDLKKRLQQSGLMELGRLDKFYKKDQIKTIDNSPFKIYRGFTTSIHLVNNELQLLVDVSTRIIRGENLLKTIQNLKYDDEKDLLIGRSVLTTYGNWRIYPVKKIKTNKKVSDTFKKNGESISYLQYYQKKYGVKIKNTKQQLILSSIKKKVLQPDNKLVQVEEDIYLVPQLVNLTGMSDDQKNDFRLMQQVAKYTKLSPKQRIDESRQLVKKLQNSDLYKIQTQETKVEGYILNQPTLLYGNNQTVRPTNGIINTRAKILRPMDLKTWVVVYTERDDRDRDTCDNFVGTLKKCSSAYGIKVPNPEYIIIDSGKVQDFIKQIEAHVNKYGKPQIFVTLLKNQEKRHYPELKKLLLGKLGIPHQAVVTKSVENQKRKMSVCSKVLLQMNAKLGDPLWKIQQKLPSLKDRKILIGGMAIYHKLINKNQSCCAFAGTVNDDQTQYYLGAKLIPQNQQNFASLYSMVQQWVKTYCQGTKSTPDTIIVYRDGVGQSQIKTILDNQVGVIKKAIETIKSKMKKPDYNPGIVFVLANKKINQRIYDQTRSRSRERTKGTNQVGNPQSGTVVGKGISRYGFDFHMAAQNVTEGTCNPTQFNVIYNTSNLTEDEIWTITFESCFGYFNWSGAVKVPASLQYANKLSTLIGDSMKSEPDDKALKKKIYCL